MHSTPEDPYRELRSLLDHLVETTQATRDHFEVDDGRFRALDDVLRQAHAYQQTSCERCGAPFQRHSLHAEEYVVAGYAHVCPRCNRELGGAPELEGDRDGLTL